MAKVEERKTIYCDVCIVGGGASGLVSAIKAKELNPELSVLLVEKMEAPGKKVAAAGNGRCNLSNVKCDDWEKTSAFFSSIGLLTRTDEAGRIYPYSEDGRDVVRALTGAAARLGVELLTRRQITAVTRVADDTEGDERAAFELIAEFNKPKAYYEKPEDAPIIIRARKLVLATGGKSKPKLGSSGDGYSFAKSLGHSVNKLIPVLTGVETEEDIVSMGISGIREKARLTLKRDEEMLFQDKGEVQFTDYGISGIVVFDMTRFMDIEEGESVENGFSRFEIEIDFLPEFTEDVVKAMFEDAPDLETAICSMVKNPVAQLIMAGASISTEPSETGGARDGAEALAGRLKHFTLHPKGLRGWDMAQVTRGGVPLDEIDEETGESRTVPNLYLAGEVLDYDGPCGGFNLQHAWTTGLRVGLAIGRSRG